MANPQLTSYATVKAERFSSKFRNKVRMPTLATSKIMDVLASVIIQGKEIKVIKICRKK